MYCNGNEIQHEGPLISFLNPPCLFMSSFINLLPIFMTKLVLSAQENTINVYSNFSSAIFMGSGSSSQHGQRDPSGRTTGILLPNNYYCAFCIYSFLFQQSVVTFVKNGIFPFWSFHSVQRQASQIVRD